MLPMMQPRRTSLNITHISTRDDARYNKTYPQKDHRDIFMCMMTSSNGNFFRVTVFLWGESTGHRLIQARDAELWYFIWSLPGQRVEQTVESLWFETPLRSLWRQCNDAPWSRSDLMMSWKLSALLALQVGKPPPHKWPMMRKLVHFLEI